MEFWELYSFYNYISMHKRRGGGGVNLFMYSNISHEVGTYPDGNKGGLVIVPPSRICTAKRTINTQETLVFRYGFVVQTTSES